MLEQAGGPEQGLEASRLCLGEQQPLWPLSLLRTGTRELTSGSSFCLPGPSPKASHEEELGLASLPEDLVSLFCLERLTARERFPHQQVAGRPLAVL